MNPRLTACHCLLKVIRQKKSLSQLLEELPVEKNTGLIKAICFGVLRYYFHLSFIVNHCLSKELKAKDTDILILILIGLYQIIYMRIPDHAAVFETVNGAKLLKKS